MTHFRFLVNVPLYQVLDEHLLKCEMNDEAFEA